MLTATLGMSERLACKAVGLARSTHRRRPVSQTFADPDTDMGAWLRSYGTKHPCHGFRRAWAAMRYDERREVNKKKIHRLWREEGLQVRVHSPRKRAGTVRSLLPFPGREGPHRHRRRREYHRHRPCAAHRRATREQTGQDQRQVSFAPVGTALGLPVTVNCLEQRGDRPLGRGAGGLGSLRAPDERHRIGRDQLCGIEEVAQHIPHRPAAPDRRRIRLPRKHFGSGGDDLVGEGSAADQ
jgi:HTH-like domain